MPNETRSPPGSTVVAVKRLMTTTPCPWSPGLVDAGFVNDFAGRRGIKLPEIKKFEYVTTW